MRAWTVVIAVVTLAVSGCIGDTPAPSAGEDLPGPDLAAAVAALVGTLPCDAPVADGDSGNVAQIAHTALDEFGYGSPAELWIHEDRAFVARYATGGFDIVDITDPLAPVQLGYWDPEATDRGLDVKATPDGTGVLMGGDDGIRLVDVRDPAEPVLEAEVVFAAPQAHMLTVFVVDNASYVAASKGDGADFPIYQIDGEPGARRLVEVSRPQVTTLSMLVGRPIPQDLQRTHDAFFFVDPLLDAPTLWLANPWDGIAVLDVSDPAAPRVIAQIPNIKPQYTHTVQTVVVDERRITVSVSEVGVNSMKVYDTTDLAAPVLLAEWATENPAQPQHNIQVVPPYVYVAHYGEGVFVFSFADLVAGTTEPIARLASTGSAPQSDDPTVTALAATGLVSGTWDVVVRNGLLYVTDSALRVAVFGCITPGDVAMSSLG